MERVRREMLQELGCYHHIHGLGFDGKLLNHPDAGIDPLGRQACACPIVRMVEQLPVKSKTSFLAIRKREFILTSAPINCPGLSFCM